MGYNPSKLTNVKPERCPCFYISRKNQIKRYYSEIGFNNKKHANKLINKLE
jgi:hypothetical protein